MDSPVDLGRRALFGLRAKKADPAAIRPPWADAQSIAEHCTHCGDCMAACPERILIPDRTGAPVVDFSRGGCTFCGACADRCAAPVFQRDRTAPWRLSVAISDRCLAGRGVLCESCRDACADAAIRFVRAPGRVPMPEIVPEDCTGCGACVSVCPETAIIAANSDKSEAHV